ncbi:MAG: methyl-accepting chemotaxis protein [Burkholderiales bacterium]
MKARPRGAGLLARMSVGRQLAVAFASLLLLTALAGGVALDSLRRVQAQSEALAERWLQGAGHVAAARAAVLEARDVEIRHSRATDRSYHAEYEEKIAEASKAAEDALAARAALVEGAADRGAVDAAAARWADYRKAAARVVALGKERKQQDAADISDGAASMAFDETVSAVDALAKATQEGGRAAAAHAREVFSRAIVMVAALLGVTLLLGAVLGWAIVRGLLRQLGGEPRIAAEVAQRVSDGDLATPIPVRPGDETSLLARLAAMQTRLADAVAAVRRGAEGVATASVQIAQGNRDLSGRTEQQASALQQTAATMDELGSTVRTNADNARQANQLAQGASEVARRGGAVVEQVVETMGGISDSSRKIAEILSVIDGIAFQTNILALNAAVEAARAGEQGRGFAVVAGEVRTLAQRSGDAARQIKGLIADSVRRVEQGGALVGEAGRTMAEIVGSIQRVTDIVGEIATASAEQSDGVAQVGEAVAGMDRATQQNAALVEQSSAAADQLSQQADELVRAVDVFRLARG